MNEVTLTLSSPITEEQWDMIADYDFNYTNEITFHTKHGKTVKFVKESAQIERRWIPCSERLPEEMTYVLVTDKDGDVYSVKFIEVIDGQAEWVFDNGIIAWMPLPEPYDPLTGHMNPPEE